MFGLLRTIVRIAFVMFLLALVVAYFTNPTKEDFSEKVRTELNKQVVEQTDNPALNYIAELGKVFTNQVAEKMVVRKNYYVCSVFSVQLPDGDYNYLGAYGFFYPLQDKNPLDNIKDLLK